MSQRPVKPVQPHGMEFLFFYRCPHCAHQVALISPLQPAIAQCDACGKTFPVVPVDVRSIQYVRLMFANGKAAADSDFI